MFQPCVKPFSGYNKKFGVDCYWVYLKIWSRTAGKNTLKKKNDTFFFVLNQNILWKLQKLK